MQSPAKMRITGTASVVAIVVMCTSIWQMIPYGIAGNVGMVALWFTLLMISTVVGLGAALMYYYARGQQSGDHDLEHLRISVFALANSAKNTMRRTPHEGTSSVTDDKTRNQTKN